ncbi:MAG: hypothetical protein VKJ46_04880, partial [Leptolyngbyaceae bacterium]|nr:hypothetical protein [Leptolyngbyaceae bacterium]
ALSTALRWNVFSSWTGLNTFGLVLIVLGVGRRRAGFKPLIYLAVAGITVSAYELLFYQVQDLVRGDQLLALAALGATLVYAYRILTPWLSSYFLLNRETWCWIAHLHWGLGSALLVGALIYPVQANQLVGLGAGAFLTRYAIMQGRHAADQTLGEGWVYLGLLEGSAIAAYAATTFGTLSFGVMAPWSGAIAALAATSIQFLPWQTWGWSPRPWQYTSSVMPMATVLFPWMSGGSIAPSNAISLLVVAGFYYFLTRLGQQPRWMYLSVLLVDGAIARLLGQVGGLTPFAIASLVGLSILSLSWIEPACYPPERKSLRHFVRMGGLAIVGGAALLFHHQTGILPGILGIVAIFIGLGLRMRAFLYVGTVTFVAIAFYQLVILSFAYPLIKWLVGLIVGIAFIWIAASFETRREQLSVWLRHWLNDLESWE